MADSTLNNKYFVSSDGSTWQDVVSKWDGVKVLSVNGLDDVGDAVNVYTAQWVNSQSEDMMVTTQDGQGHDVVVRKNSDISVTLIVSRRFTSSVIDEQSVYDNVVSFMAKSGAFYIRSAYSGKDAHVVCLKSFKPTNQRLNRGSQSFILVTIPLHTLDVPSAIPAPAPTPTQNEQPSQGT